MSAAKTFQPTVGQVEEMNRMQSWMPSRIVWAEIKNSEFVLHTSQTRRQLNAAVKAGQAVYVLEKGN